MTIYSHTKICLIVAILSFIVLVFGVYYDPDAVAIRSYLLSTPVAFIGGFLIREFVLRQDLMRPDGAERIDELPPVLTTAALMTIWMPVALAGAAIFMMFCWDVSSKKISWILIVLAGMCGQHLASLRNLCTNQ